jgi:hypothetical protein
MQVSNYKKNQVTFSGIFHNLHVVKSRQPIHYAPNPENKITLAKSAKNVAETAKSVAREIKEIFNLKGCLADLNMLRQGREETCMDRIIQFVTNKGKDGSKPFTEISKVMSISGVATGICMILTGTMSGLLNGLGLALVSSLYAYSGKKKYVNGKNAIEIAKQVGNFYNKKNPPKMRTIQEIETHLKNYKNSKHLMDLKPKTPMEIAARHKGFLNKPGINKRIDLSAVSRPQATWIKETDEMDV